MCFTGIISKVLYKTIISAGAIVDNKLERDTKHALNVNEKVLKNILKRNEESEIGKKYDFKNIKTIDDYKNKVPITKYDYYEEYIKRMAKGEKKVLMCDEVEYFGHTSGTTGKQKLIPSTKKARMIASKYMAFLLNRYPYDNLKYEWKYGRGLLIADIVMTSYTEGNIPVCSATSGGMKAMGKMIKYLYTSPYEVMTIKDKESSLYLHILFALKERGLTFISGVFISSVLDMFRIMEENHLDLVKDIRTGKVNRNLVIDDDVREKLNSYLEPDAMRADELEKIFKDGFRACARKIWPSLVYIGTVTGANFSIYDDKVNYYTNYLPIYSPCYAATEATIGMNKNVGIIKYIVIPDTVFYEFLPVDMENKQGGKIITKNIDELEIGEKYEVLVTNYSGLYRYRLGDVVRVVGYYNNSPEIVFEYRKNQVLNMASEKTNEMQLVAALRNTVKISELEIIDYITEPDNNVSPGRYIIYVEFKDPLDAFTLKRVEKQLEIELKRTNIAYDRARYNFKLSPLKLVQLKKGTFNKVKESMYHKGVSKNQIKVPRVINKENIRQIIKEGRM